MRAIIIATVLMFCSAANAIGYGEHVYKDAGRIKNALACDAALATRTWTSNSAQGAGYALAAFQFDFTRAAATSVTWTCYASVNNGTSWAQLQSCSVTSGLCTSSDASWTKATGASSNFIWRVDFLGASDIKCIWSCAGGGASDLVTIWANLSTI